MRRVTWNRFPIKNCWWIRLPHFCGNCSLEHRHVQILNRKVVKADPGRQIPRKLAANQQILSQTQDLRLVNEPSVVRGPLIVSYRVKQRCSNSKTTPVVLKVFFKFPLLKPKNCQFLPRENFGKDNCKISHYLLSRNSKWLWTKQALSSRQSLQLKQLVLAYCRHFLLNKHRYVVFVCWINNQVSKLSLPLSSLEQISSQGP